MKNYNYQISVSDNLKFDCFEFKNGQMYFYKLKKLPFNFLKRKEVLHLIISYKGGEINIGDMWYNYKENKAKKYNYPQNLNYKDIEKLGKFLSESENLELAIESYIEKIHKL